MRFFRNKTMNIIPKRYRKSKNQKKRQNRYIEFKDPI